MLLSIRDFGDDNFIYNYLPKMLYNKIEENCKNIKALNINKYLKNIFKVSIDDILKSVKENILVSKVNNLYNIRIDNNVLEPKSKLRLVILLKLINSGNINVKGTNAIEDAFNFIKEYAKDIYLMYLIKEKGDR